MVRTPSERPIKPLPPERAFVLQLEGDTDLSTDEVGGRVEHVVPGRAVRFQTIAQLLEFLRRVLGAAVHEEGRDEIDPSGPGPKETAVPREECPKRSPPSRKRRRQ